MVNVLPGPNGNLHSQEDPVYQQWRDARTARYNELVEQRLGNMIKELNGLKDKIALEVAEEEKWKRYNDVADFLTKHGMEMSISVDPDDPEIQAQRELAQLFPSNR